MIKSIMRRCQTMKWVNLKKKSSPSNAVTLKYCDTFFSKLLGLMFSKALKKDSGLILVEKNESRLNTSIHMLFMNYDITVLWLDSQRVVVDKVLAKRWRPFYWPKQPAKYVVELHSSKFSDYELGDQLEMLSA
jgi:uncharacterized membrane protein (UPF0127 family)